MLVATVTRPEMDRDPPLLTVVTKQVSEVDLPADAEHVRTDGSAARREDED